MGQRVRRPRRADDGKWRRNLCARRASVARTSVAGDSEAAGANANGLGAGADLRGRPGRPDGSEALAESTGRSSPEPPARSVVPLHLSPYSRLPGQASCHAPSAAGHGATGLLRALHGACRCESCGTARSAVRANRAPAARPGVRFMGKHNRAGSRRSRRGLRAHAGPAGHLGPASPTPSPAPTQRLELVAGGISGHLRHSIRGSGRSRPVGARPGAARRCHLLQRQRGRLRARSRRQPPISDHLRSRQPAARSCLLVDHPL